MGLYTNFYDRVQYGAVNVAAATGVAGFTNTSSFYNKNSNGWGIGGGIIAPIITKRLDFQVNGLYGRGINRYGPGAITDATFNRDGSERPVRGAVALLGLTFHATPAIDFYGYAGLEQVFRSEFGTGSSGTGGLNVNDTGCFTEGTLAATCNGTTRRLYEFTGGFWDKLYKGSFGEVRVGANYAFVHRDIFNSPVATAANGFGRTPGVNDHIVMTSFRYYPFQ